MYMLYTDPILAHLSNNPDDYFAKGTTEHLTFLRVMREAHRQFPFRNKKDAVLIDNALEVVYQKLPMLRQRAVQTQHVFYMNTMFRIAKQRKRKTKMQY
ncbi:hypothetical protein ACOMHN_055139 [Nucella lapillus]